MTRTASTEEAGRIPGFEAFAAAATEAETGLGEARQRAGSRFATTGFPTRRDEAWRFTDLSGIAATDWEPPPPAKTTDATVPEAWCFGPARRLVFVDGRLARTLSDPILTDRLVVSSLRAAASTRPDLLAEHLDRPTALDELPFATLSTALHQDGAVVIVPDWTTVDEPIHLVFLASGHPAPTAVFTRNLIALGAGARATVVETHLGPDRVDLSAPATQLVLAPEAALHHAVVQEAGAEASHTEAVHAVVERGAGLDAVRVNLGGGLVRNDIRVDLVGEGASARLAGLYMVAGREHVDNALRVRHSAPHCDSEQLFKGIVSDRAQAVFTGCVVVEPGAQKTNAMQANRNLLLSDRARAHSNPQLEILADDVRCTHGSTTGRLDEDALFYLRSRGIAEAEARRLLVWAFAREAIDTLSVEPVRSLVEDAVRSRLEVV